jgi:hypothetical protein
MADIRDFAWMARDKFGNADTGPLDFRRIRYGTSVARTQAASPAGRSHSRFDPVTTPPRTRVSMMKKIRARIKRNRDAGQTMPLTYPVIPPR